MPYRPAGRPPSWSRWSSADARSTVLRAPALFLLAAKGHEHDFGERFELQPFDRNNRYIAGCMLTFRTLLFGVNFESVKIHPEAFAKHPAFRGTTLIQPFNAMDFSLTNVELQLRW